MLVTDLLQLAHLSLRPRLSNEPDPVHSHLVPLSVPFHKVHDQGRDALELDEAHVNRSRTRRIPVLLGNRYGLRGFDIISLLESEDVVAVGV